MKPPNTFQASKQKYPTKTQLTQFQVSHAEMVNRKALCKKKKKKRIRFPQARRKQQGQLQQSKHERSSPFRRTLQESKNILKKITKQQNVIKERERWERNLP